MTGDLRKQIKVDNKEVDYGLTFLDGKLIADRNPARVLNGINNRLSTEILKMETFYPHLMRLNSMNGGRGPLWRTSQRDTLTRLENSRRTMESLINTMEDAITDISGDGYTHRYSHLLSPDTISFFVFHASGTGKDAHVVISRILKENNGRLKELWTTEIPGLFHDPSAASETNTFKEIFSKGSPEFRFSQFDLEDNKLIIIWMLHVHCLDTETGTILWKFRV